ncbi:hypothetical protein DENSPDRAFT_534767 [Dentipellis sp. KUC8613]|nr:hypothetical protein DENSPDRAFT_534767 [Dentipellis sp. KUC8613]
MHNSSDNIRTSLATYLNSLDTTDILSTLRISISRQRTPFSTLGCRQIPHDAYTNLSCASSVRRALRCAPTVQIAASRCVYVGFKPYFVVRHHVAFVPGPFGLRHVVRKLLFYLELRIFIGSSLIALPALDDESHDVQSLRGRRSVRPLIDILSSFAS